MVSEALSQHRALVKGVREHVTGTDDHAESYSGQQMQSTALPYVSPQDTRLRAI